MLRLTQIVDLKILNNSFEIIVVHNKSNTTEETSSRLNTYFTVSSRPHTSSYASFSVPIECVGRCRTRHARPARASSPCCRSQSAKYSICLQLPKAIRSLLRTITAAGTNKYRDQTALQLLGWRTATTCWGVQALL